MAMPTIRPESSRRSFGNVHDGRSTAAPAASAAAAVSCGMRKRRLAIVGGIILGILENLASGYLDPLMPSGGGLANVFPFIIMLVVLVFMPHGLFGLKRIERV